MTNVLRNKNSSPLSEQQLRGYAPAVFADLPSAKVSGRYNFIPTYRVVEQMHNHGYAPVEARTHMGRASGTRETALHSIRFRSLEGDKPLTRRDQVIPEIMVFNSHDTSSALRVQLGLYRVVCTNGLIAADRMHDLTIKHSGALSETVRSMLTHATNGYGRIARMISVMDSTEMSLSAQDVFARRALEEVFGAERARRFNAGDFLGATRQEDKRDSVWVVMNRVQEKMARGGMLVKAINGKNNFTRGITSVKGDFTMNASLWALAASTTAKAQASGSAAATAAMYGEAVPV